MVDRWDEDYTTGSPLLLQPPDRQDIALSFAHKLTVLIAIVVVIMGLWAVTSQPANSGASGTGDATLGPPLGHVSPAHAGAAGR